MTNTDERYNGWTNRETWAVALHINNDQGWQESVHEALTELVSDDPSPEDEEAHMAYRAGEIIRENVESVLEMMLQSLSENYVDDYAAQVNARSTYMGVRDDIGSLWRVDWTELGRSFLEDIAEQ